jgi:clan AA aspartic protease
MGLVYVNLDLANPSDSSLKPITVKALADTGAYHLCIPEHVAIQLNIKELEKREVTLADGGKKLVSYSGPIMVRFDNRSCFTGALVMGDTPLLGAIPMEDMDLVVHPLSQKVIANPNSPNIPSSVAMGVKDVRKV